MIFANTWTVAPWANSEILIAVIVALGGIGASAGFWETLRSRRKKKISAEEHEKAALEKAKEDAGESAELVASAMTIVHQWQSMVKDITARHDKELKKVYSRLSAEEQRGDRQEREIQDLKDSSLRQSRTIYVLRSAVSRYQDFWTRIETEWDVVRQHPRPPRAPQVDMNEEV